MVSQNCPLVEFYDHAKTKVGQGGFLQVSESREQLLRRSGPVSVALIKHTLADGEDGFQSILAQRRGWNEHELVAHLPELQLRSESLISSIKAGAGVVVAYSCESRLAGVITLPENERLEAELIRLVDPYLKACSEHAIGADRALEMLDTHRTDLAQVVSDDLWERVSALRRFALSIMVEDCMASFYDYLAHSPVVLSQKTEYQRFLGLAADGYASWGEH
jgi:hypothetical protein